VPAVASVSSRVPVSVRLILSTNFCTVTKIVPRVISRKKK
jgi:hypothetical protein